MSSARTSFTSLAITDVDGDRVAATIVVSGSLCLRFEDSAGEVSGEVLLEEPDIQALLELIRASYDL